MKKNSRSAQTSVRSPRHINPILKPLTAVLIAIGCISPALAVDKTWFGGTGDWGDSTKWSPGGVPGAGDLAIINAGTSTLSFNAVINRLSLNGGTLAGVGNLFLTGESTWTGGAMDGAGTTSTTTLFSGDLNITGDGSKSITGGRVVTAAGNTTWTGNTFVNGNQLLFGSPGGGAAGNFVNFGTFTDTNAFDTRMSGGGIFNNAGTYNKQNSTITTIHIIAFDNNGTTNVNAGILNIFTNDFANTGIINVAAGALFHAGGTTFDNTATGVIGGNGTVATSTSDLSNSGNITPGNSIGHLTIAGDLKQTSTGDLSFELASSSSFDLLTVTGNVSLGGTISVLNAGYSPMIGDSFKVMTFNDRAGTTFSSLSVNGFGAGVNFNVLYNPHDVTLQVTAVPEAETWVMMLAGLGLVGFMARRRNTLAAWESA